MLDNDTLEELSRISNEKWRNIIAKCYNHIDIRLYSKTSSGAHCEQRLGTSAHDYYFVKAYEAIYAGTRSWDYKRFSIEEQLIRIIDSMISEEVRKYKVEMKHNKKTVLIENEQLSLFNTLQNQIEPTDSSYNTKLSTALRRACQDNSRYTQFIQLRWEGYNYDEICARMNCTKNEAYQMKETIAKRANKILKTL